MKRGRTSRVGTWVVSAVLTLSLFGCPMGTVGHKVTPEQQSSIQKGRTTKAQILGDLGNPDQTIDLGDGKEQLSYISEKITTYAVTTSAEGTEFWITLNDGIVQDFGQRPTTKKPNYLK